MMDQLKAMTVFVKAVEHGSFRSAAAELNLSPSVISYHIQNLEKKLGVALLYRTTRKLSLSPEGKILFGSGQKILSEMLATFDLLTDKTDTPRGELSISLPSSLSGSKLSKAIAQFSLTYPHIKLRLHHSDEAKDIINSGFDVFIRVGGMGSDGGKRKNLFSLERSLVASPDYLSAQGHPKTLAELSKSRWVGLSLLPNYKIILDKQGREHRVDYVPSIVTDSVHDMAVLSCHGLGISTPPACMVKREIEQGRLTVVLKNYRVQPLVVYAQWPASSLPSKLTQRFLVFIDAYLNKP
jgi:DNA-binding transcriptional LysR family regulator